MDRGLLFMVLVAGIASPVLAAAAPSCLQAAAPLGRGHFVQRVDFVPKSCPAEVRSPYRYDAAIGAIRLTRSLDAGEVVAAFPDFGTDYVVPGQKLNLLIVVGAVRIERDVVALQAARPGEKLFVRDDAGKVFSTRYQVANR